MIGAEFCEGGKPKRRITGSSHDVSKRSGRGHVIEHEVMDQAVARVTAKKLQVGKVHTCMYMLYTVESSETSLYYQISSGLIKVS